MSCHPWSLITILNIACVRLGVRRCESHDHVDVIGALFSLAHLSEPSRHSRQPISGVTESNIYRHSSGKEVVFGFVCQLTTSRNQSVSQHSLAPPSCRIRWLAVSKVQQWQSIAHITRRGDLPDRTKVRFYAAPSNDR